MTFDLDIVRLSTDTSTMRLTSSKLTASICVLAVIALNVLLLAVWALGDSIGVSGLVWLIESRNLYLVLAGAWLLFAVGAYIHER